MSLRCSFIHSLIHSHLWRAYSVRAQCQVWGFSRSKSHAVYTLVEESEAKPTTVQIFKLFQLYLGKRSHSSRDRERVSFSALVLHGTNYHLDKYVIHICLILSWSPTAPEHKAHMIRHLCSVLYPQCFKGRLAHTGCSVFTGCMNGSCYEKFKISRVIFCNNVIHSLSFVFLFGRADEKGWLKSVVLKRGVCVWF